MMKNQVSVIFMLAGILFTTCLLLANILAIKIIQIGPFAAPAGVLIFPVAYIINDVIAEVWGYKKARLIIWAGFSMNIMMVLFFSLSIALPSAAFWSDQSTFAKILGSTPRIVFASITSYLVGSFLNAFIMSRMKIISHGRHFGFRAIVSTMAGETADSLLFISLAFAGTFPVRSIIIMITTQALLKTVYEIIILPFTAMVVKWVKKKENQDVFDNTVSYNPFKVAEV
jgi:queuosine precursor transporter